MSGLRVAVAGAGLGGLCLAQGLVRAGVDVQIYERDAAPDIRSQGYRLHMDGRAGLALHTCLPPELFRLFLATASRPSRKFTVLSAQLRVMHETLGDPNRDLDKPETLSTSVNRGTLREILGAGLRDRIHQGRELVGYEQDAHGVTLRFVDGLTERADVLVGADGVNSAVSRTMLPAATIVDTGSRIIYGKTPLDDETRRLLPSAVRDGFTAIIGGRVGMAAGLVEFRQPPPDAAAAIAPGVRLSPVSDYLMWGVSAQHDRFPEPDATMAQMGAAALHAVASTAIQSWHTNLRALLAKAAVEETFFVRVRSSERVPAWTPSRVTLLGDAIHAMSPARGSGANTALLDAVNLCAALTAGGTDVFAAIGEYEARMRDYGFAAVEASRQAETQTARRGNPLWLWIFNHLPKPGGRGDRVH
ncbi:FAD-dependent oxidoreductase [Dactylosporangium sp. McL0621]|uniref:FAD-dependent oxidoreductase n=1 Tax=Dactylosporangium sp. McL0621 TaxID=3415678 RepID=UPI003CFB84AE